MVRTPLCDKSGLRKGTWTPEEDRKLIAYVARFGHRNWRRVPKFAGLARCGKSCRLRWMNYLRPDVKRGNYTQEEDQTIVKLHTKFGNRWSMIASYLPGRSDNEIKNHWHAHLKKRFQHNSVVANEKAEASKPKHHTPVKITDPFPNSSPASFQSHTPDVSPSPQQASVNDIFCTNVEPAPFGTNSNLALADYANFLDTNTVPINADFWTQLYVDDVSYFPGELLAPFVTEPDCSSPVYDPQLWGLLE